MMGAVPITEFLLARIAEDEAEARSAIAEYEDCPPSVYDMGQVPMLDAGAPDRVLAECEAKRRIVELAAEATGLDLDIDNEFRVGRRNEEAEPYIGDLMLRALASVYSDHPDFDPEWRVQG